MKLLAIPLLCLVWITQVAAQPIPPKTSGDSLSNRDPMPTLKNRGTAVDIPTRKGRGNVVDMPTHRVGSIESKAIEIPSDMVERLKRLQADSMKRATPRDSLSRDKKSEH